MRSLFFITLTTQAVLMFANQYDPHVFPADGPFMEGWYARIIDFESNHSFGILFGQVIRRKQGAHLNNYPLNMVSIIHSKGDESSMESFDVYPSSENVEVTVRGKPVTENPDFKSPANFEWRAKPYGYFRVNENETRFNFTNVSGVRAVYKSGTGTRGRGHWDACVGTWDLGTRGEGRGDIWYGTRDVWDAGTCGTGTRGRQM